MSFASHFRPCRRLPLRDDGLAHGRGDLAPLLAKADRVLPVIDPTPARAVIGDRRGVVERDAYAPGDGIRHAPRAHRYARGFLRQGEAESAGASGSGVRFSHGLCFGVAASAVKASRRVQALHAAGYGTKILLSLEARFAL
jgi:hypothetical protein